MRRNAATTPTTQTSSLSNTSGNSAGLTLAIGGINGVAAAAAGTTGTTAAGPKTKLNRRRGTKRRKGGMSASSAVHQQLLHLCMLIATLSVFLAILFFLTSSSKTTTTTARNTDVTSDNSKLAHRPPIPGVPNLFRGRQFDSKKEQQTQQEQAGAGAGAVQDVDAAAAASAAVTNLNAANGPPPKAQQVNTNLYDTEPTQWYPYPLIPVADDYDIAANFRALGGNRYTEYTTGGTPYIIQDTQLEQHSDTVARSRRVHIQRAMQHAWSGYQQHALGADEIKPVSGKPANNWGGQGITLVDALDTLWLMNMKDEFWQARDWVRDHLNHNVGATVSVFETTIRDLGGLLSAYDFSGDETFLEHALDLGKRLIKAYNGSPTGIPFGQVNLAQGTTSNIQWTGGNVLFAEFGTTQVENRYLSKVTGQDEFATKTEHVFEILQQMSQPSGLYPYAFKNNPRHKPDQPPDQPLMPEFANQKYTFGAMADSTYEYMLKIWLQGGKKEPLYREMYDKAMDGMHKELLQTSTPSGLTYIADKNNGKMDHKMDHLVCFMGGLLALGAYTDPQGLDSERAQRDLRTAKALTYTCYQMYARMNTGISPEFIQFSPGNDFQVGRGAPHYLLRPEAVESFFILNQLTGDPVYREWGWEVFQAIEKYCKTTYAYGELANVQDTSIKPRDKMESFFLAETLKYLYLLQDPDTEIDILHKHVFNTEAHPTRIFPVLDEEGVPAATQ